MMYLKVVHVSFSSNFEKLSIRYIYNGKAVSSTTEISALHDETLVLKVALVIKPFI